ncbi:MAG: MFS transporter [Pirellula sp.]|jgi:maltose/moltooligosaccharide transporter|nr:MFS transporter [Pirellula sp.]
MASTNKPPLSIWQIINMSVGFFGIQFGWGLQMGNMSPIYEYLGADADQLPILWLAAPLTGLLVQPIIGYMSDRTWTPLGRRRPYFLVGAILSSICLFFMPRSPYLWVAAGLLWILDASINISMEPFRAFVADMLPERQRTLGFAMQSAFICAGAVIASKLPKLLNESWGISSAVSAEQPVPLTIHYAFAIGAVVFLLAVLWTVLTTREYPPDGSEQSSNQSGVADFFEAFAEMPSRMKQLAVVQFFTWMGLFCMFIYLGPALGRDLMGAATPTDPMYQRGVDLQNDCNAVYGFTAFLAALAYLFITKWISAKWIHFIALVLGGLGLTSVGWVTPETSWILTSLSFVGVGIAWASILSMPYAMLSAVIPAHRTGVYMGIFNLFIVIPEILFAIGVSQLMENYPSVTRLQVVVFGGVSLLVAAAATLFVSVDRAAAPPTERID